MQLKEKGQHHAVGQQGDSTEGHEKTQDKLKQLLHPVPVWNWGEYAYVRRGEGQKTHRKQTKALVGIDQNERHESVQRLGHLASAE